MLAWFWSLMDFLFGPPNYPAAPPAPLAPPSIPLPPANQSLDESDKTMPAPDPRPRAGRCGSPCGSRCQARKSEPPKRESAGSEVEGLTPFDVPLIAEMFTSSGDPSDDGTDSPIEVIPEPPGIAVGIGSVVIEAVTTVAPEPAMTPYQSYEPYSRPEAVSPPPSYEYSPPPPPPSSSYDYSPPPPPDYSPPPPPPDTSSSSSSDF
jgi:hypothetical protein